MKAITIRNDFHCTEVRVIPHQSTTYGQMGLHAPTGYLYLTPSQARRARRILCGASGCQCSGHVWQRPTIQRIQEWDDSPVEFAPLEDGGAHIVIR